MLTSLSVNVSPFWLTNADLVQLVGRITSRNRFPAEQLSLEVTERVALAANVTTTLRRLRRLGVRILLDDFGSGYSSLA